MEAWYNGGSLSKQATHYESAAYIFHGTFNPVRAGTFVMFWDSFVYQAAVGNTVGQVYLTVEGDVHQVT